MDVPSCDLLGLWHRWHTVEIVLDGSPDAADPRRLNHAVRVMRCSRCGATSWRWSLPPSTPPAEDAEGGIRTVVHVRRTSAGPASP